MFAPPPSPRDDAPDARDLLRLGMVQSVDLAAARCVVAFDDELITGPIPWGSARAGAVRIWAAPSVGEQVLVFAAEGDLERAIAGPAVFFDGMPAPANDDRVVVAFEDGTTLAYLPASGDLELQLVNRVSIVAPGGADLQGDLRVEGDVQVTGKLAAHGEVTSAEDVKAGSVSLKAHVHFDPAGSSVLTGAPKP